MDGSFRSPTARLRKAAIAAIAAGVLFTGPALAVDPPTSTGPSTTTPPYVLPVADGVHIKSLLTVNDAGAASNGYEMVGIPDGLGMIRQGANLVLYMNHELRDTQGIVRRHGRPAPSSRAGSSTPRRSGSRRAPTGSTRASSSGTTRAEPTSPAAPDSPTAPSRN